MNLKEILEAARESLELHDPQTALAQINAAIDRITEFETITEDEPVPFRIPESAYMEQLEDEERQVKECRDYGKQLLDCVSPNVDEVIKLIAEQGSHAWRNERTLTAIFKLTEMKTTITFLGNQIRNVSDKRESDFDF